MATKVNLIRSSRNSQHGDSHERAILWGADAARTAAKSADFDQSIGVIIGIDNYCNGIPSLSTAVNDARWMAQILEQEHGYRIALRTDVDATRESLEQLLGSEMPTQVGANDRVVFYFAGHGVAMDADDGPAGYLIPQDACRDDILSFWAMTDVHRLLTALPCRHLLAIFDCCFAGAFRWSATRALQPLPNVIHRERYERFLRDPAWQVITSAAYDQRALDVLSGNVVGLHGEVTDSDRSHSPFASALFDALAGGADLVPKGGDGVITATELYMYLREQVDLDAKQKAGHEQTPGIWPLAKHRKGEFVFLVPGKTPDLPPAPELTRDNNPYQGLDAYEEAQSDLYFGRAKLIKQLAHRVATQPLTLVLGASGTGKSSLVKAGLIPALGGSCLGREGAGMQESSWYVLPPLRPGNSPEKTLNDHLSAYLTGAATDSDPITTWVRANPTQKLLMVIDQLEELVTQCRNVQERTAFADLLTGALQHHPDSLRLVMTLRSDFEPQIADIGFDFQGSTIRFVIPPMSQDELREVIEKPASVRVLYFEPDGLVDQLINDVLQTPGALPLLSFTLSELYFRYLARGSDDRAITQQDYLDLGGVIGSLRRRANEEYEALDASQRATMRRVMLRMVSTEGGELARRRVPMSEIDYLDATENARVENVLDRLSRARLIVQGSSDNEKGNPEPYVEPAHDALIIAWDRLQRWHANDVEMSLLLRRLTQASNDWLKNNDPAAKKGLLWDKDPRLPQVQHLLDSNEENPDAADRQEELSSRSISVAKPRGGYLRALAPDLRTLSLRIWLNRTETAFVKRSIELRRDRLRTLSGSITLVIVTLSLALWFANEQRITAEHNAAETSLEAANLLTTEGINALNRGNNLEAGQRFAKSIETLSRVEQGVLSSDDPMTEKIQRMDTDNRTRLRILDQTTPSLLRRIELNAKIQRIRFGVSPGEVVLQRQDGIEVWNGITGERLGGLIHEGKSLREVWYAPDGNSFVAAFKDDPNPVVWDLRKHQIIKTLEGHQADILHVAFSADGTQAVTTAQEITALLWNTRDWTLRHRLPGHENSVLHAAFSPKGDQVATACLGDTARLWRTSDGMLLRRWHGHPAGVDRVLFTADGKKLATVPASDATIFGALTAGGPPIVSRHDDSIRLYDLNSEADEPKLTLKGMYDGRLAGRIVGSERLIADYHQKDGTGQELRLWNLTDGQALLTASGETLREISQDGRYFLTQSDPGGLRLRATAAGESHPPVPGNQQLIGISPGETWLATRNQDNGLEVLSSITGIPAFKLTGFRQPPQDAAFDKSDELIAVLSGQGTIDVWRLPRPLLEITTDRRAYFAEFGSRDDILLTTGGGTSRITDAMTGRTLWTAHSDSGSIQPRHKHLPSEPHQQGPDIIMSQVGGWAAANFSSETKVRHLALRSSKESPQPERSEPGHILAISPNGEHYLTLIDRELLLRRASDGFIEWRIPSGIVNQAAFIDGGEGILALIEEDMYKQFVATITTANGSQRNRYPAEGSLSGISGIYWDENQRRLLIAKTRQGVDDALYTVDVIEIGSTRKPNAPIPVPRRLLGPKEDLALTSFAQLLRAGLSDKITGITGENIRFSSDGTNFLTTEGNRVLVWDGVNATLRAELDAGAPVLYAAFDRSGERIVSTGTDGRATLWSVSDGRLLGAYSAYRKGLSSYRETDVDMESIAKRLAQHRREGGLFAGMAVPELHPWSPMQRQKDRYWAAYASFDSTTARVAVASHDGTIRILDLVPDRLPAHLQTLYQSVRSGAELDDSGELRALSAQIIETKRGQLSQQLAEHLTADDPAVRAAVAEALVRIPASLEQAFSALIETTVATRAPAPLLRGAADSPDAMEFLARALSTQATDTFHAELLVAALARAAGNATPILSALLQDERIRSLGNTALDAIDALGRRTPADPAAAAPLIALLIQPDQRIAAAAATALVDAQPSIDIPLIQAFEEAAPPFKQRVAEVMAELGIYSPEGLQALSKLLSDLTEYPREVAARLLIDAGPVAIETVKPVLHAPAETARSLAAGILEQLTPDSPIVVGDLIQVALRDPAPKTRVAAAEALRAVRNSAPDQTQQIFSSLTKALHEPDVHLIHASLDAVVCIGFNKLSNPPAQQELFDAVVATMNHADPEIQRHGGQTLLTLGLIGPLLDHLAFGFGYFLEIFPHLPDATRKDLVLRVRIVLAPHHKAMLRPLAALLKDPNPEIRWSIADAIANLGHDAVLVADLLFAALDDRDSSVQFHAAKALFGIPNYRVRLVPVLGDLVEHASGAIWQSYRKDAANLLRRIGPPARSALPNLERALLADTSQMKDPDDFNYRQVQTAVLDAIEEIGAGNERTLASVETAWRNPDFNTSVRLDAARVYVGAGHNHPDLEKYLLAVLEDPARFATDGFSSAHNYRVNAATALVKMTEQSDAVRQALSNAMNSPEHSRRHAVITGLLRRGRDTNTLIALLRREFDPQIQEDPNVRAEAAELLKYATTDQNRFVALLMDKIEDTKEENVVRQKAAKTLLEFELRPGLKASASRIRALLASKKTRNGLADYTLSELSQEMQRLQGVSKRQRERP